MSSDKKQGPPPEGGSASLRESPEEQERQGPETEEPSVIPSPDDSGSPVGTEESAAAQEEYQTNTAYSPTNDAGTEYDGYTYDDPYAQQSYPAAATLTTPDEPAAVTPAAGGSGSPPPVTPEPADDEDDDDEGMLKMSFLQHLEELRSRLIRALMGIGVAFFAAMFFAESIWLAISSPAADALGRLGYDPTLAQINPTDAFTTIWMKVPLLCAAFLASPWIVYQVWGFIAPGLYKRERRFAGPFIICTAGLFILGGLFAYFVAFRFGLEFLLGIGRDINVKPVINLVDYFDLFVNVTLGIGLVFEMPVIVFFLTFLRITTARFLIANSRYAILGIVILAAVVTPTPDIFNLMIFSVPMVFLYFVGVFASYLLELRRDQRSFPWASVLVIVGALALLVGGTLWLIIAKYGYQLVPQWPFLIR